MSIALGPPVKVGAESSFTEMRSPNIPRYWAILVIGPLPLALAPGILFRTSALSALGVGLLLKSVLISLDSGNA